MGVHVLRCRQELKLAQGTASHLGWWVEAGDRKFTICPFNGRDDLDTYVAAVARAGGDERAAAFAAINRWGASESDQECGWHLLHDLSPSAEAIVEVIGTEYGDHAPRLGQDPKCADVSVVGPDDSGPKHFDPEKDPIGSILEDRLADLTHWGTIDRDMFVDAVLADMQQELGMNPQAGPVLLRACQARLACDEQWEQGTEDWGLAVSRADEQMREAVGLAGMHPEAARPSPSGFVVVSRADLQEVVEHMWEGEREDFEDCRNDGLPPERHIFSVLTRLNDALTGRREGPDEQDRPARVPAIPSPMGGTGGGRER